MLCPVGEAVECLGAAYDLIATGRSKNGRSRRCCCAQADFMRPLHHTYHFAEGGRGPILEGDMQDLLEEPKKERRRGGLIARGYSTVAVKRSPWG